jgi:hypothetical protein
MFKQNNCYFFLPLYACSVLYCVACLSVYFQIILNQSILNIIIDFIFFAGCYGRYLSSCQSLNQSRFYFWKCHKHFVGREFLSCFKCIQYVSSSGLLFCFVVCFVVCFVCFVLFVLFLDFVLLCSNLLNLYVLYSLFPMKVYFRTSPHFTAICCLTL